MTTVHSTTIIMVPETQKNQSNKTSISHACMHCGRKRRLNEFEIVYISVNASENGKLPRCYPTTSVSFTVSRVEVANPADHKMGWVLSVLLPPHHAIILIMLYPRATPLWVKYPQERGKGGR